MTTLADIEAATDALSSQQKEELLLFLAVQLRSQRIDLPLPRTFSSEQITNWIADDEAEMRRFREGQ